MSFPAYPSYRDSGVEWLDDVPSHWTVTPLKVQAAIIAGQSPNSNDCNLDGFGRPFLQGCAEFGDLHPSPKQFCEVPSKVSIEGDILLSVRAPVGALNISDQSYGIGRGLCAIRAISVASSYLRHALSAGVEELQSVATGSTYQAVSTEQIGSLRLPLPPLPEQTAIAAFLDRETAKIDALVEEQRRLIELLKEKRQAVISHAVTKGLDPMVPMKDSGVEWLSAVPAHWAVKPLRAMFRFVKRQEGRALDVLSVYRDYGVIRKSDRDDNINKTPEDLSRYQTVAPADLVINKMKAWQGSLGIAKMEGIISPDYAVFVARHGCDSDYLNFLLRCQLLPSVYRSISNGIRPDQWRLEPDRFKELLVPVPPNAEQSKIAAFIAGQVIRTDALALDAEAAISLLQERRGALISAAVSGKIDVRSASNVQAEAA